MLIMRQHERGFTLIELIVGVMIIGILAAVGIPSFTSWIQTSQIRTAAETMSNGLQLARAEAVRRNTNVQFSLTGPGAVDSSWSVGCVTPVADLNLDGVDDCPAVIQSRSSAEGTRNAVIASNSATVVFSSLGRSFPAGASTTMDISNPTGGTCMAAGGTMRCLRILVTTGGSVRMCNPALPSSNPQGC